MANFLEWSDAYSVGIQKLDDDHRELLDLVSRAMECIIARDPPKRVARRIDDIVSRTRRHFAEEEWLMERTSYPNLGPHRYEHQALLEQIAKALADHARETISAVDLCTALGRWLLDHIAQSDKPLAEHLNKAGAGQ